MITLNFFPENHIVDIIHSRRQAFPDYMRTDATMPAQPDHLIDGTYDRNPCSCAHYVSARVRTTMRLILPAPRRDVLANAAVDRRGIMPSNSEQLLPYDDIIYTKTAYVPRSFVNSHCINDPYLYSTT